MTTKHLELFASFVSGKWHQNARKKIWNIWDNENHKNSECWVEMTGQKTDWDSRRNDMVEKHSTNIDAIVAEIALTTRNVGYSNSSKKSIDNKARRCHKYMEYKLLKLKRFVNSFQLFLCGQTNENEKNDLKLQRTSPRTPSFCLFYLRKFDPFWLKKYIFASFSQSTVIIMLHAIRFTMHNNRVILCNFLHPVWVHCYSHCSLYVMLMLVLLLSFLLYTFLVLACGLFLSNPNKTSIKTW